MTQQYSFSPLSSQKVITALAIATGTSILFTHWAGHIISVIKNLETLSLITTCIIPSTVVLTSLMSEKGLRSLLEKGAKIKNIAALNLLSTLGSVSLVNTGFIALMQYHILPISLANGAFLLGVGSAAFLITKLFSTHQSSPILSISAPCTHLESIEQLKKESSALSEKALSLETENATLKASIAEKEAELSSRPASPRELPSTPPPIIPGISSCTHLESIQQLKEEAERLKQEKSEESLKCLQLNQTISNLKEQIEALETKIRTATTASTTSSTDDEGSLFPAPLVPPPPPPGPPPPPLVIKPLNITKKGATPPAKQGSASSKKPISVEEEMKERLKNGKPILKTATPSVKQSREPSKSSSFVSNLKPVSK